MNKLIKKKVPRNKQNKKCKEKKIVTLSSNSHQNIRAIVGWLSPPPGRENRCAHPSPPPPWVEIYSVMCAVTWVDFLKT